MLTAYHIFFEKSTDLDCKTIDIIAFAGYLDIFRNVLSRKLPLQCVGVSPKMRPNPTTPRYSNFILESRGKYVKMAAFCKLI